MTKSSLLKIFHGSYRINAVIVVVCIFVGAPAFARWASREDADTETKFYHRSIHVNADGTYEEIIESLVKILKEGGRTSISSQPLVYNASNSTLEVLEVKTINGGKESVVSRDLIEDKPLASSPQGFDQNHQVMIAYPRVELNTEVYLKYRTKEKKPPIDRFFSTNIIYGWGSHWLSSKSTITSELPLHLAVNDPDHVLEIHKKSDRHIEVQLSKPIIKQPLDEPHAFFNPKSLPWVTISTIKEWPDLGKRMIGKYENVVNQPLPEAFEKIRKEAEKKPLLVDKINTITSMLAATVTYMGDWRTVAGAYVPRDLAKIAESRLGDCKDFSATTAAILRRLGVEVNLAWVTRGEGIQDIPNDLPQLSFNHAIIRVQKDGKILWIDPTNFTSFAQGVFPDIADRKALVFDPKAPRLDWIPALKPKDSGWQWVKNIDLRDGHLTKIRGEVSILGTSAIHYTGLGLRASRESIDFGIVSALGDENRMTGWKVENYDLTSRIVKDLSFKFSFVEKNSQLRTSAGPAFLLPAGGVISTLLTKTNDRVSDLYVGSPMTIQREFFLAESSRVGSHALDCKIESPWATATRQVVNSKGGIRVKDSIVTHRSVIPNPQLISKEFGQFQEKLSDCFNDLAVVYKFGSKDSSKTAEL